jgi:PTH2 family peptidyl-tRNA hydrolase
MSDVDAVQVEQVMEVCGCSLEAARHAVEASGGGGVDLAVDIVLSTMSSPGWGTAGADEPAAAPDRGGSKLVCLVRQDLGMGVGKVAAQVAHGALGAVGATRRLPAGDAMLRAWEDGGEATIVLAVRDHAHLQELLSAASAAGLPTHCVADAGRTEVAAGSQTVGTVGPAPIEAVDAITGRLGLL